MAYGVDCARYVCRSLGALCSCGHFSCRSCCVASFVMCEGWCGEWDQEDPFVDNVGMFGGAHVCKAL